MSTLHRQGSEACRGRSAGLGLLSFAGYFRSPGTLLVRYSSIYFLWVKLSWRRGKSKDRMFGGPSTEQKRLSSLLSLYEPCWFVHSKAVVGIPWPHHTGFSGMETCPHFHFRKNYSPPKAVVCAANQNSLIYKGSCLETWARCPEPTWWRESAPLSCPLTFTWVLSRVKCPSLLWPPVSSQPNL